MRLSFWLIIYIIYMYAEPEENYGFRTLAVVGHQDLTINNGCGGLKVVGSNRNDSGVNSGQALL